ncbi:MAG: EAL domain-containing protein [Clostridiales bacterium]|nr:EAL domain-containing protein [Clostridiales bacterium]
MGEKMRSGRQMDKTLRDLSLKKEAPKGGFILLVLVYLIATVGTVFVSVNGSRIINVLGNQIPFSAFAGVISSIANICVICLVVLYRKVGFFTALILLVSNFPMLAVNIFIRKNVNNLPGFFMNLLAIVACLIIYFTHRKVLDYQQTLRDQAVKDRLTGLPNRFACTELMSDLVKHDEKFALVTVDLNDFKSINDTMGHDTGNEVLKAVADRWSDLSDTMQNGLSVFVARLSADEFILIISGYSLSEDADRIVTLYRDELEKKLTIDGCDYFITACFGITEYPRDDNNIDSLFLFADAALHEAKRLRGSGNSILRFSPEILNSEKLVETERKLRYALDNKKISFNLQPQFDINHKLRGFEALARMRDSDGSYISPTEFIPVAEKSGLIDRVDIRVFELAVSFLADVLRGKKETDLIISCNVSVKHLMKNSFLDEVKGILVKYQVPASNIEFEITESVMIDSMEKAMERIDEIKALGMKVAIDDFGTGYSSLSYLNSFPSDLLKIDKSFIDLMNTSESSKKYVAAIITIGHVLNFSVISEGVEEESQIDTLREIGCDYIQGFVWGRPMSADDALELVFS